jgi:hypothetical protein
MAETMKKYGDATIFHDGSRSMDLQALVLGARYDAGVKLGPDGEPALTLAYLNPDTPQNGPLRGNLLDSVVVVHDVPYLASEDLTVIGYSDTAFNYPVPQTPTLEEKLEAALQEIEALKAEAAAASATAAPAPVASAAPVEPVVAKDGTVAAGVVPPASPTSVAEQHEAKPEQTEPVIPATGSGVEPATAPAAHEEAPAKAE